MRVGVLAIACSTLLSSHALAVQGDSDKLLLDSVALVGCLDSSTDNQVEMVYGRTIRKDQINAIYSAVLAKVFSDCSAKFKAIEDHMAEFGYKNPQDDMTGVFLMSSERVLDRITSIYVGSHR